MGANYSVGYCINIQCFGLPMSTATVLAEEIHPSLWRASQLARGRGRVVDTGYPALSAELPGGGWPVGALVDLLVQ
jgi:protein ImuA